MNQKILRITCFLKKKVLFLISQGKQFTFLELKMCAIKILSAVFRKYNFT